ncbi:MAG: TetR/AcrR family transcriptional regulator [Hyphomicrobiales bacterium]|nr:TetR/AcrR family transcriptional regulator [Hyphomicrobiales bacterium]MCP4999444.1 TetR/AcrR family transcriptional regulator [Hyphomicrobiales bacterium]
MSITLQSDDRANVRPKKDRTRKSILRAAATLFRDCGYHAASMRDIADAAGMKAGSIYYHFQSKDEILVEILDTGVRGMHAAVREAIDACGPDSTSEDRIGAAVRAHLGELLAHRTFTSAKIRIYGQLPEAIRQKHRPVRRSLSGLWEELLAEAQSAGAIRADIEIKPLRQFLTGALNWSVEWYDEEGFPVELFADRATGVILRGIMRERKQVVPINPAGSIVLRERAAGAQRKSARTRLDILTAAAGLFRNKGYVAATLRDIAAATQMKAGSIYYHFSSKDEILDEILELGLRDIQDGVRAALGAQGKDADPRTKISVAAHAHLNLLLTDSEFTSANFRIYGQLPERFRMRHRSLRQAYFAEWETLLVEARDAGAMRADVSIVQLRQFLLCALNSTVEWHDPSKNSVGVLVERCTRIILDGIATGEHQSV